MVFPARPGRLQLAGLGQGAIPSGAAGDGGRIAEPPLCDGVGAFQ